jgi:23S rRNA (adenine2503-C2)-methyltransferase
VTKRLGGVNREALGAAAVAVGEPENKQKMRGKQLFHWMYHRGATDFDAMTSISMDLRARMKTAWDLRRDTVATEQISVDGTRKWLVELDDGAQVESVLIPEDTRGALCISTQVGCTLNCSFCHTGTQPWVRNLTTSEIVGQVLIARDVLGEWPSPAEGRLISNIVLMGMGEPLLNYENVAEALKIIMDPEGISISRRRITVSTAGVVPMMGRLGAELGVGLAISLHAVRDDVRNELVPLNRKHPIAELLEACRTYPGASNARRITFEYAMLKGVNDSAQDAKELVQLIAGIPAKVNLIPFNPWPSAPYQVSDDATIDAFAEIVNRAGYASPIRVPRGRDISAACGQLKSDSVRISAKSRQPA